MLALAARRLALTQRPLAAITSTASRRIATGTEPAPTLIDPVAVAASLSDESARVQLSKLREMEDDLLSMVSVKPEPIDWDAWRSQISYPGLVDEIKAEYENIKVPDISAEIEKADKAVDELFDPIIAQCEQIAEEANAECAELDKKLTEATYFTDNIDTMTVEEYLERNPAFKKQVEDDIANNRWFVDQNA